MNSDGGVLAQPARTGITLVYFGTIDRDIQTHIRRGLGDLLREVGTEPSRFCGIQEMVLSDPGITGGKNSGTIYCDALGGVAQGIGIGVTRNGLWMEFPFPRFIFATGSWGNTAILSLHRFLHDSSSRRQALVRIAKEVPKVLAQASGLPVCDNPACYLCYHWVMEDFDANTGLCPDCRARFAEEFNRIFPEEGS